MKGSYIHFFSSSQLAYRRKQKSWSKYNPQGNNSVEIRRNTAGNNPLVLFSSDIDTHSIINLSENTETGVLHVSMTMTGDQFPAAEAFVTDKTGQNVYIGVSGANDSWSGPYGNLPGDGKLQMITSNFDIKENSQGQFVSIEYQGQSYSIDDWNRKISSTPVLRAKQSRKNDNSNNSSDANDHFPRVVGAYGIVISEGWEALKAALDAAVPKHRE
jgi:hypothetical protein